MPFGATPVAVSHAALACGMDFDPTTQRIYYVGDCPASQRNPAYQSDYHDEWTSIALPEKTLTFTITLNRPDARNTFSNVEHVRRFSSAVGELQEEARLSVLIVNGAGSAFCAGGDVKDMQNRTGFAAG